MRLLLASSADGFLAAGPADDMSWTGPTDKAIFRLLTLSSGKDVLLAGSKTFDLLPPLPGRVVKRISRTPGGLTLPEANAKWAGAWLIGGPTLAVQALRLGLIDRAFICVGPSELGSGVHAAELESYLPPTETATAIKIGDVRVLLFTESLQWPGK